jgi:primosomal protein N''
VGRRRQPETASSFDERLAALVAERDRLLEQLEAVEQRLERLRHAPLLPPIEDRVDWGQPQ